MCKLEAVSVSGPKISRISLTTDRKPGIKPVLPSPVRCLDAHFRFERVYTKRIETLE